MKILFRNKYFVLLFVVSLCFPCCLLAQAVDEASISEMPFIQEDSRGNKTIARAGVEDNYKEEKLSSGGSEQQSIDKPAKRAYDIIFSAGVFVMALMAGGVLFFAYKLFPKDKKAKICPAEQFLLASRIVIPLPRGEKIIVKSSHKSFSTLVNNFTDETKASDEYESSMKLGIKIKNKWYKLEVSLNGWNFQGEQPNSRVLRNSLETMEIINSLQKEYLGTI